jgi:DHA1 family bicyclomycin/chloramphenicol resistance-like MFS transporter
MLRPDTLALTGLLALLTSLGPVSTDMYLPSLPDIGRTLAASAAEVQLTLSAYLVGFAIGQIFYGPVSDRYGRKPILLVALSLYCAASFGCALAPNIDLLILLRVLQAVGASGAIVIARAAVRDLYAGARAGRELSLMGAIMALAPVIAPPIGGVLQTAFGWRANFLVALAIGLAVAALVWRLLPETLRQPLPHPASIAVMARDYALFSRHGAFLSYLAIVALSYAGLFAWISGSSFVLQDLYGLTPFQFGISFTLCGIGFLCGTTIAARLVTRIGLDRTMGLGAFALAGGGFAMAAALAVGLSSVAALVLPMVVYLAGLGLAMPQAMAGALTPFPHNAGAASSFMGFVQQTGAALVGVVVGQLVGETAWPVAAPIAACGGLTLIVWLATQRLRARLASGTPAR